MSFPLCFDPVLTLPLLSVALHGVVCAFTFQRSLYFALFLILCGVCGGRHSRRLAAPLANVHF